LNDEDIKERIEIIRALEPYIQEKRRTVMPVSDEFNPTVHQVSYGALRISRIVPGDGSVHIEWSHNREYVREGGEFLVEIAEPSRQGSRTPQGAFLLRAGHQDRELDITGLSNGVDYAVYLSGYQDKVKVAQAPARLLRPCPAPGVTVAYNHPDDYTFNSSGRYLCSPSLLRLPGRRLLVCHDIYLGGGGQNLSHVYYSDDDGASWHFLSALYPCFWPKLFLHQEALFVLCCSTEYGNFQIYRSGDWGKTWSQPSVIIPGHEEKRPDLPGPHRAPTPLTVFNGRLWSAVEYGTWGRSEKFGAGLVSIALDDDPLEAANWTISPFAPYSPGYPGAVKGGDPAQLEGNIVVSPNGGLVNFMRYQTNGADPDYGKAILYKVDHRNPGSPPVFDRIIDFPGNLSKFNILRDPEGPYISLVNRVSIPWRSQRNILSLAVSEDLYHWRVVKDLINYQDNGWPEGYKLVGFQYVDFFIEDGDIYYLSRTALGGAHNFHDSNRITFHKLENYKQYLE
jgi:hypothetical protein